MGKALNQALEAAQKMVDAMEKTKVANGVKFVPTEEMIREARRCLLCSGLVLRRGSTLIQKIDGYSKFAGKGESRALVEQAAYCVTIEYVLAHPESGDSREWKRQQVALPEAFQPLDKAIAAALTFDFGYAIRDLLMIPRVEPGEEVDLRQDLGIVGAESLSEKLEFIARWKEELRSVSPSALEKLNVDREPESEEEVDRVYDNLKTTVLRFRKIGNAKLFLGKLGSEKDVCERLGIPEPSQWATITGEEMDRVCEAIRKAWGTK